MTATKITAYRCVKCHSTEVGYDATSTFNPVTQAWELGHQFDDAWCNDCGETKLEIYDLQGDELTAVLAQQHDHAQQERLASNSQALADALDGMVETFAPFATEENKLIVANAQAVMARITDPSPR